MTQKPKSTPTDKGKKKTAQLAVTKARQGALSFLSHFLFFSLSLYLSLFYAYMNIFSMPRLAVGQMHMPTVTETFTKFKLLLFYQNGNCLIRKDFLMQFNRCCLFLFVVWHVA